uniref:Enoyl-CoA hydratase n=1 Tax=Candidatus Kentrum sp. FW TaxID=2126338 RepID=A0A450T6P0_9GAMM|nr:MAG: enoyl-CoA hydratase [Candidatus Kentron sp. FW]
MDYHNYQYIRMEREGTVLVASFDRPESLNAMNGQFHTEMSRLFADIARDRQTNAIVLTGTGKAFSAGGDIKWFQEITPEQLDALFMEARKIIIDLLEVEQPIIAAVNGFATGLGATVALFSDIIIASEKARIGDPHVQVGVVAGDGGAVIWPWLVGAARAKEFLMTGDLIDAREAHRMGLVNRVVPHDDLMPTAMELATRLANGPAQAIRGTKASINKILKDTANLVLDTSLALEKQCFHSRDHREAIDAFAQKREPVFTRARD